MQILQTLVRVYVAPEQLDAVGAFYEQVFGETCKLRMPLPALGREIASIASMHLIAGSEEKLQPSGWR